MIRYDLVCNSGHEFDGWFGGSEAFEKQQKAGLLDCPICGTSDVVKALMAPGIPAKSNTKSDDAQPVHNVPANAQAELVEMIRKVRDHVAENSEYVGDKFAEEARKIHYEETEQRGIYGEATIQDATELKEEGIEVHALPTLPEERN